MGGEQGRGKPEKHQSCNEGKVKKKKKLWKKMYVGSIISEP